MSSVVRFTKVCGTYVHYARVLVLLPFVFALSSVGLFAQAGTAKPRVAVFGFLNMTGDDGFGIPAETAGKNLSFSLRTLGLYDVSEQDEAVRDFGDDALLKWCADNGVDSIMYGVIRLAADGSQSYQLSVFDASKKMTVVQKNATGQSAMDVFSVSDELTLAVLGAVTGHHVGFGSIALSNAGVAGEYSVGIDEIAVGGNPRTIDQIASGAHRVRVFIEYGAGREEVLSTDVLVRERETTTVDFALPAGFPSRNGGMIPMVHVIGGNFNDGANDGTIDSFLIGSTEVTQAQYASVLGRVPKKCSKALGLGDGYPVYFVSWYDALVFCNALSLMESLTPVYAIGGSVDPAAWGAVPGFLDDTWEAVAIDANANGYRLPTKAEWEFAARGGNGWSQSAYSGSDSIADVAWFVANSGAKTNAVGGKAPNGLGLFDMSGNVFEWCYDRSGSTPSMGSNRVLRGGSWDYEAAGCTLEYLSNGNPAKAANNRGFRVVRRP